MIALVPRRASASYGARYLVASLAVAVLLASSAAARAADPASEPLAVPLWPEGDSRIRSDAGEARIETVESGERKVTNVHAPSIAPYIPDPAIATGCAVIIAPGGGHREMWIDHEGHNLARWLQGRGIAAFVLLYRLAREEGSTYTVDDHALADMQRAVRTVRARADEWHIVPQQIGVMGFSAGGELAALAAMRNDAGDASAADDVGRASCRPDFQVLVYPGSSRRFTVAKDSPAVFIVCGYEDRDDISRGMAEVYLKYKDAGVPAEMHIYAAAGHGFGYRDGMTGAHAHWPERFVEWLADMKMLKPAAE